MNWKKNKIKNFHNAKAGRELRKCEKLFRNIACAIQGDEDSRDEAGDDASKLRKTFVVVVFVECHDVDAK